MGMISVADAVVILIIIALVAGAAIYMYRSKKKGQACIGCPYSGSCPHKENSPKHKCRK